VLLAQQTAANLHAATGDRISIGRAGLPDGQVTVDGIVDLPAIDPLFQKVGAPAGAQPQAPPDNVLLVPAATWHELFDPAPGGVARTQVHARIRHALPPDPAAAYTEVSQAANHLDAVLAGTGTTADNLGATLASARADARYADVLFLFLGAPGAVLGALLTAVLAGSAAGRRRWEQALLLHRLATQPDAVLVSAETAKDFQLHPGDLVRLRLPAPAGGPDVTVPFHYAGVVNEFPTAPTDSFLVANAAYLGQHGGGGSETYLVGTAGAGPPTVAERLRRTLGPTAQVSDIDSAHRLVGSSLTAVNLSTLGIVELGFALLAIAVATGLLLGLTLTERRRMFSIARAIGARPRQLASLVWAEITVVGAAGLLLGAGLGWLLAELLVAMLAEVFDPPPDRLAVPASYLATLGALAVGGARCGRPAQHPERAPGTGRADPRTVRRFRPPPGAVMRAPFPTGLWYRTEGRSRAARCRSQWLAKMPVSGVRPAAVPSAGQPVPGLQRARQVVMGFGSVASPPTTS
jgi:hypothetical protein